MDFERAKARLEGCYITVPTMFRDPDLDLDLDATRRVVRFLLERGIDQRYGTLLAGGAAGDFSTMTFDERLRVAEAVVAESDGRVPVAMGAQTTSTLELKRLAKAAERIGAEFIQVSPPFYFTHTEADFHEYVAEAAAAADVGIIVYNTFWTSAAVSFATVERLVEIPNVVGLKWACPRTDAMEFEDVVSTFSGRLTVIDNHLLFALSHMLGARAFEVHLCNYWPEWGITPDRRPGSRPLPRGPARARPRGDAVLQALGRDRADLHQRRRLYGQAVHGAGRPDFSRCRPPTRDVRVRLARALPPDADRDRRAGPGRRLSDEPGRQHDRPRARATMSAIATRDIAVGEEARDAKGRTLTAREPFPSATRSRSRRSPPAPTSAAWRSPVGIATSAIGEGDLVHVHNVKSHYLENDEDHYE